jgi:hypothetical protein
MNELILQEEAIAAQILMIRGQKVMLDADLATIYGVETKVLNQAVKRNLQRFPEDFMFQLEETEWEDLRSQFVTANWAKRRTLPYAFTEHGAVMLASVLNSILAIHASLHVVRVFVKMRSMLNVNAELARRIQDLEASCDHRFTVVFDAIHQLMEPEAMPRERIGFVQQVG